MMRQRTDLRDYQRRVVDFLYERPEAFAVLRMGAGKTVSTLTAIRDLMEDEVIGHALIVAPKRVARSVWPAEIESWAHLCGLEYAVLDGSPAARLRQLEAIVHRDLTIIGIDNIQWLLDILEKYPPDHVIFDCLVIDETSKLKNPTSKRAKALARLAGRFRNRWGLTGTPRPNGMMDLFNPVKVVTNARLWGKSFYKWRAVNFYPDPHDYTGYKWLLHPHREEPLLRDVAEISIALAEGEMPELPEISILLDEVRLPADALKTYREMESRLFTEVDMTDVLAASRAVATGKLAQIANGFLYGEGAGDAHAVHGEKEAWLADLVETLNGEPLLVVYEYQEDLAMIRRVCGDVPYLGAGVTGAAADKAVTDWNAGRLPVMALHPASGGHGLNLQHGGSRMAWVSPTWSPEMWEQTVARLHRPGQAAHVMVHVCMAAGTVDELKRLRVISKLDAQAAFESWLGASRERRRDASPGAAIA